MIGDVKVLIDPKDYDRISGYHWHIQTGRNIIRCKKLGTSLQKFILNVKDAKRTAYHVNGNPWNNRRDNLKECSTGEAAAYVREFTRSLNDAVYANLYLFQSKVSFM